MTNKALKGLEDRRKVKYREMRENSHKKERQKDFQQNSVCLK